MKKKVIRLNEQDVENLVKKIIKEEQLELDFQDGGHTQDEMNDVWERLNRMDDDRVFDLMELTFNEESMSVEDFINNLPSSIGGYDYEELISILKQIKEEGI
jgi:benzoyl-CoA reductase/2-hydroxyglutaryl-CoA dehydratase subunit BcrC/BadD/HgdB